MPDHTNIADKEGPQVALLAGEVPHPIDLRDIPADLQEQHAQACCHLVMSQCTCEPCRHSLSTSSQDMQPVTC